MATRRPLVLIGGVAQELPAADTLPGSVAPGTIAYFASDPGAGWLKCDRATYLRSSYPDLSAAMPINLLNCPPSFGGADYSGLGGGIFHLAFIPGTNYMLAHCSGFSGKQLELIEYDPATQSISRVGAAPSYSGANVRGMSVAQDGATTYVAGATYQSANRLDLFKIVGTTITKLAMPTVPATAKVEAVAFYNGGANLAIGISAGDPTSDVRIWTYSRSGDTFTKLSVIGGLPASPVSFRSMSVSPSGKTLWATLDRNTDKKGHLFDVSGSTLTNLTESGADPINSEFNAAFAPRTDIDLWFSGSSTLFAQYRLGATNAVLGTNGRVDNSSGQYNHVGAKNEIAFSPTGELLVTTASTAPWRSVFRVHPDYTLTPMFSMPDATMEFGAGGLRAVFTPDSRCIATVSSSSTTISLVRSDTTKLIVPRITNGWIKT